MEKIDEFIDYSTGNQEELMQIARVFEQFTAQNDFKELADVLMRASAILESKDNQIPNLEGLQAAASRYKQLKRHINALISLPSIQKMCKHYHGTGQQIFQGDYKDESLIMLHRLLEPLQMHIQNLSSSDLCERIQDKAEMENYLSNVLPKIEKSSSILSEISKQHSIFSQQMTRFQVLFRKSGLAQKMCGEYCQICKSSGMFSTKEHLILVLVGILFETFDEVEQAEEGIFGIQVSFFVHNFLQFVGFLEPQGYEGLAEDDLQAQQELDFDPQQPKRPSCFERWQCLKLLMSEVKECSTEEYKEIFKGHQQKADQQFIKAFFESSVVDKQDAKKDNA